MRIISGSARGRRLFAPVGLTTRPIPDRAKTAIFNMITSIRLGEGLAAFDGIRALDLYAGSGSFGLECLSRGAAEVVFVERGRPAVEAIRRNVETLGFVDRARVVQGDVRTVLTGLAPSWFDVAFCDPPYADDPWSELLPLIPATLLVAHTERELPLTDDWVELRRRSYGRPQVVLARHQGS